MRTPPCGTYPEWCAICPCSWLTRWATVRRPAGGNGGAVLLPGPAFLLTETSGCFKNDVCVVDALAFLVTVMILWLCFIVLMLLMCTKFGLNGRSERISMIMVGVNPLSGIIVACRDRRKTVKSAGSSLPFLCTYTTCSLVLYMIASTFTRFNERYTPAHPTVMIINWSCAA